MTHGLRRNGFIMTGRTWQQEWEAAGHITSVTQKQADRKWGQVFGIKVPQLFKTEPPAGDNIFKYIRLWGSHPTQTKSPFLALFLLTSSTQLPLVSDPAAEPWRLEMELKKGSGRREREASAWGLCPHYLFYCDFWKWKITVSIHFMHTRCFLVS